MSWLRMVISKISSLFGWNRAEREMNEEMESHLAMLMDENRRKGMSPEEARRAALHSFGGVAQAKEAYRDQRGLPFLETLVQDIHYGLRQLRRNPGFTAAAILTLALGISANTAVFSVINAVMLRMMPVQKPEEFVAIGDPARVHSWSNGTPRTDLFSYPLYREVRDHNRVFSSVLASSQINDLVISIDGSPEKASGRLVTGNYFETLGVKPLLGRFFSGEQDRSPGSDPFVVISYGFWQGRFSGAPSVLGRTVHVNNYPFTIVGVAPSGFWGEVVGDRPDLWVPMMMEPQMNPGRDYLETPDTSTLLLLGRLRPRVTIEQAREDVNTVVKEALTQTLSTKLSADDRDAMRHNQLTVELSPGGRGLSRLREEFSTPLLLLMGMVALVLLIACVNVANLMLARSASRRREFAVRLAIGAGRGRIARQLLTEAVLLSTLGGAFGLLLAHWGAIALVELASPKSTMALSLGLDLRVLAFTAGVSVAVGLLFGLAPALQFLKPDLDEALNEGGRAATGGGWGRTGRILVSLQIGLSVLVLMAASLFVRSLRNLKEVDLGYSRDHLVLASVDLIASGYRGEQVHEVTRKLLDVLSSLPGVLSVTASSNGLYSGNESSDSIRIEGYASTRRQDLVTADDEVGPNYFSTIGVPIVLGREIALQDYETAAHVAVVNETFAKFYFGGQNPLGRAVYIQTSEHPDRPPYEIIGVARDVHDHGVREPVRRRMYAPLTSADFDADEGPTFELRCAGNPRALLADARKKIRDLDANLVVRSVETGGDLVTSTLISQVVVARLSAIFGVLVLTLVCVGLYGSMSYRVIERTREIGVRMALGAQPGSVLWTVTREACFMLALGVALGLPAGVAATRLFQAMLFGVGAADPVSIAAALAALSAISFAAAVVPARRATKVDPIVALHYE